VAVDGHVVDNRPHFTLCVCVCGWESEYVETGNGAKERRISGSRWTCVRGQNSHYCAFVGGGGGGGGGGWGGAYVETGNGAKGRRISGSRWACGGGQTLG